MNNLEECIAIGDRKVTACHCTLPFCFFDCDWRQFKTSISLSSCNNQKVFKTSIYIETDSGFRDVTFAPNSEVVKHIINLNEEIQSLNKHLYKSNFKPLQVVVSQYIQASTWICLCSESRDALTAIFHSSGQHFRTRKWHEQSPSSYRFEFQWSPPPFPPVHMRTQGKSPPKVCEITWLRLLLIDNCCRTMQWLMFDVTSCYSLPRRLDQLALTKLLQSLKRFSDSLTYICGTQSPNGTYRNCTQKASRLWSRIVDHWPGQH